MTHHDPSHTDAILDEKKEEHIKIAKALGLTCEIEYAKDKNEISF